MIRVTDEQDGELLNRGYSYWSQVWIDVNLAIVFCGHADGRPRFFQVDLETGAITRLGPLIDYIGTGEGWYWTPSGRIMIAEGPRLHRVNPFNPPDDEVVLDVRDTHPGCRLWQAHSSDDGLAHSATLERITQDGPYERLGTIATRGLDQHLYGPTRGALDESQISRNGRFLVIKEGDDNRIIDFDRDTETIITNSDGALGHSDNGPDFIVGENDQIGACEWVDLGDPMHNRRPLFSTWNMGHVSVRAGRCLLSGGGALSLVAMDASGQLSLLAHHGMIGEGYDYQVHGNLDHSGRVACYLSNAAGRMDVYLVVL